MDNVSGQRNENTKETQIKPETTQTPMNKYKSIAVQVISAHVDVAVGCISAHAMMQKLAVIL